MRLTYYLLRQKKSFLLTSVLLVTCILTSSIAKANSNERWQRIRTAHYDIIFLANMVREAQHMANTLETLYVPVSNSLYVAPKRIPIILKSQITISNGMTTMGPPRRGEFFTFPTQDYKFLCTNDWLNLLAVHELRHVAQFDAILPNLTLYMPHWDWFLEGDAVGIETALSTGGRGRSPYFELLYKVNLLERGGFSYYKQMLGSLNHQIPDHYRLGYFMTTYLRRKYGRNILHELINEPSIFYRILRKNGLLQIVNPFGLYIKCKKLTGRTLTEIYEDTNAEIKTLWTNQLKGLKISSFHPLHSRESEDYTDYTYPQPTEEGIIVLKSGISTPSQFVEINEKAQENIICTPASLNEDAKFSITKNKIIWLGNRYSISRKDKVYTTIQSYDQQAKKFKTIVQNSRYSAVDLSPDATQIVAFETDESYNHRIVILDAENGKVIHTFPNPENYYYLTPTWSSDGENIIAVRHLNNKATISIINPKTGSSKDILSPTEELIGCPILDGTYVYYNSAYSGIDNIYAININTKQKFQVTSSKYGAYNPAISKNGKWLLYNDFGKDGMNAVKVSIAPTQWTPIEQVEDRTIRYYEPLITQENNADILSKIPDTTYPIEEYTAWKNFNNVRPQLEGISDELANTKACGIVIRDLLGKYELVFPAIGYGFSFFELFSNSQEKKLALFTRYTYRGWYPVITSDFMLVATSATNKIESNVETKESTEPEIEQYIREVFLDKKFRLSLNKDYIWNAGEYRYNFSWKTSLTARSYFGSKMNYFIQNYTIRFYTSFPICPRYGANNLSRDIYTPWGQQLLISYHHTPYGGIPVNVYDTELKFYFPGLLKHHSLCLSLAYKLNIIPFPHISRGSRCGEANTMKQPITISVDYAFPIAYPNFEQIPFSVLQRLRGNLFYDCVYNTHAALPSHTIGIDFILDLPWLNIGIRCGYKITDKKPIIDII
jgi:hypothetical protein